MYFVLPETLKVMFQAKHEVNSLNAENRFSQPYMYFRSLSTVWLAT